MPADGISLPLKRDFGTSRWGGSKVRLHQRRHRAEGVMAACGTNAKCQRALRTSADRGRSGHVLCLPEATRMTRNGHSSLCERLYDLARIFGEKVGNGAERSPFQGDDRDWLLLKQ
jgi:hypothetical protein